MALILCPACSHEVSDQASACPNCGHPLTPYPTAVAPVSASPVYQGGAPGTSAPAIVSLVAGLAAWCIIPVIGAVIAVVAGHIARSEIRRAPVNSIDGAGMALAGLILGWTQLVLMALLILFLIAIFSNGYNWH